MDRRGKNMGRPVSSSYLGLVLMLGIVLGVSLVGCGESERSQAINEVFERIDPDSLGTVLYDKTRTSLDADDREILVSVAGSPQEVVRQVSDAFDALGFAGRAQTADLPAASYARQSWSVGSDLELRATYFAPGSAPAHLYLDDHVDPSPAPPEHVLLWFYIS